MGSLKKYLTKYLWFWVIILSIPAVKALLVPGFFGSSDDMHIAWLYEMDKTIKIGQIPPRFVPDLSFGFGYPLFNFVFPLPFYLAEIFHLLGLSLVDSVKALFGLSILLSGLTMYKLLKELTFPWLSLVGAVVYMYTPYRATDLYVRGAIGEVTAFIFLPLIILTVIKLTKPNLPWIGIGALSIAALCLSHNITVYMFLPAIFLLALLLLIFGRITRKIALGQMLLTLILGLLSSIYFWLPAILDSGLMKYDTVFNFIDHFPTLKQLITPYFGYGASVPGPYDGMSFFIGLMNLILVLASGVLSLIFWKRYTHLQKIILVWVALVFSAAVFMMNFRSSIIWENMPLLPYFQFPWRFLILTTATTPLLVIALGQIKFKFLLSLLLIIITVFISAKFFKPHDFLGRQDDYYINRYIPLPVASKEYLVLQEEYLRLSKNTSQRPEKNSLLYIWRGEGSVETIRNDGLNSTFKVRVETAGNLLYSKYFFPGWKVLIDGKEADINIDGSFGQLSVFVPKGLHIVEFKFGETAFKTVLDLLSIAGVLFSLKYILAKNRAKRYNDI